MQTTDELQRLQAQPLERKIVMTCQRIREWVGHYGEDGVYVSFSGGKDSTVLLDIVRNVCGYKNIPAVFVDVPTQFPELKEFVQKFDNVVIVKPKISFYKVCEKYGFPIISKEVSENVEGAKKYLTKIMQDEMALTDRQTYSDSQTEKPSWRERAEAMITSTEKSEELANILNERIKLKKGGNNQRLAIMLGWYTNNRENLIAVNIPDEDKSIFSMEKYKFLLTSEFDISPQCCKVMKKEPAHRYSHETGRMAITAQMAAESRLRTQMWIKNGCNGFNLANPMSNPMAFWTENDVLEYIYTKKIGICSVYGEVVEDYGNAMEGQMTLSDYGLSNSCKYKTTGCDRTGCAICAYGSHLDGYENSRFRRLKETHPKMYGLLDIIKNHGVTYREAIEWINDHMTGRGHIYL